MERPKVIMYMLISMSWNVRGYCNIYGEEEKTVKQIQVHLWNVDCLTVKGKTQEGLF